MAFKFNKRELNKPLDKKAEKLGDALITSGMLLIVYAEQENSKVLFYFCIACMFIGNFLLKFYSSGDPKSDNE